MAPFDTKRNVYLIDFENTREYGIKSIQTTDRDLLIIVYTANAAKLDLDSLSELQATLQVIRSQTGKQALDLLLVSYLGFAIADLGKSANYIIISNDGDYDGVVNFWKSRGYQVERQTVDTEQAKKAAKKSEKAAQQSEKAAQQSAQAPAAAVTATSAQSAQQGEKAKAPAELMNHLSAIFEREKVDPGIRSFIRQKVSDLYPEPQRKSVIYRAIIGKYGQKNGLKYYNLIKKEL
ncbi:MAG: NYN domain-containing protein [Firmicutes bacterium]|nr:NYN domain-containing protein [Bacillota bacterium]